MTLGEKIKEARKEAGLSQEQLAEKMSVSRSAIAKWETDKGIPDVNNLKVMSQLLGVSIDYLLDDGEKIFDFLVQPGIVDVLDRFKELAGFYLVEKGSRQYFVKVTNDFITTNELAEKVSGNKFVLGDHKYRKGYKIL